MKSSYIPSVNGVLSQNITNPQAWEVLTFDEN